ncbi:MAG TPA: hydroxymethylbilane synthase [Rhizobiales bacterium]|nr:hydroxymethylbilane synthase [Hyphomicrobiales bacterium]
MTSVTGSLTPKVDYLQTPFLKIGTRGSLLALAQAHEVRDRLAASHGIAAEDIEIIVIKTTGDKVQDRSLSEIGGKGLFTKEIEEALFDGRIDIAVHSMKDMPTLLPPGMEIAALLPREDARDAFLSPKAKNLAALPDGAIVGSSSLRRAAQIKRLRPDIGVVTFRGNVQTRLKKLASGQVDATLLAYAGLKRLGLEHEVTDLIATGDMLPAVAQGAIGIEIKSDDIKTRETIALLNHENTEVCVAAERAFLAVLDGSCQTPIAGYAEFNKSGCVIFRGMILKPDGSESFSTHRQGSAGEAAEMGRDAGMELSERAGPDFLANH